MNINNQDTINELSIKVSHLERELQAMEIDRNFWKRQATEKADELGADDITYILHRTERGEQ